jgi:hypothetical protein
VGRPAIENFFAVGEMEIVTRHGRTLLCSYNSEKVYNDLWPPLPTKLEPHALLGCVHVYINLIAVRIGQPFLMCHSKLLITGPLVDL